jgi:predicted transposase YdaD
MKTDKQLCLIFEANPQWLFELTGLPSPGPCRFQSMSLKAIEQTADGVLIPDSDDGVITILEIQFQRDEEIYLRVVMEMVLVQQKMRGRKVQGVILFVDHSLDPRTEPWCHFVSVHSLADTLGRLAAEHPAHPLVAVFQPLMQEDAEKLEQQAAGCYNQIASSGLDEPLKSVLLEVFINWLEQRFVDKGKAEIEKMLVGQLPDLRETQSGKDLIAIGVQEGIEKGIEKGKRQSLVQVLESRFGPLGSALIEQVEAIKGAELLDRYFRRALSIHSLDQLFQED